MIKIKFIFIISFCIYLTTQNNTSFAQTKTIRGKVINNLTGNPIPAIRIAIKNSDINTISSSRGEYELTIPDTIITIQFADFQSMELLEVKNPNLDEYNIYLSKTDFLDLTLEELMNINVTTAGKRSQHIIDIPASVVIINRSDIENYGYQTLEDILFNIPGLYGIDDYGEAGVMFGVRGFWSGVANANIIIMINGIPQTKNSRKNHILSSIPIPVDAIDKIEIVRGPLSVIYGSGAFFGAINIITNESNKLLNKDFICASYGNNDTKKTSIILVTEQNDFKFAINASLSSTAGIDKPLKDIVSDPAKLSIYGLSKDASTSGILPEKNIFINFSSEYKDFYASLVLVEAKVGMEFDIPAVLEGSTSSYSDFNFSLGYKKDISDNFSVDLKSTYFKDRVRQRYSLLFSNFFGFQFTETNAFDINFDAFYNYKDFLNISSGLYYKNIFNPSDYIDLPSFGLSFLERGFLTLHKNDYIESKEFYLNSEIIPTEGLRIIIGFRVEKYSDYRIDKLVYLQGTSILRTEKQNAENTHFIPRFAFLYNIDQNHTLKLLYGKANNQPSFFQNELNLFDDRAKNLSSEFIETYEINYITTINSNYSFSISLFNNQLTNLITRVLLYDENNFPLGSINSNAGKMVTNGIEISAQAEPIKDLRIDLSLTYQKTKDQRKGFENINPAYSPNFLGYFKASYHFVHDCSFALLGHYTDVMETYWNQEPKTSGSLEPIGRIGSKVNGYFIIDANFRIDNILGSDFFVNFSISNLLNTEIRYPTFTQNSWADKGTIGYGIRILAKIGYKF